MSEPSYPLSTPVPSGVEDEVEGLDALPVLSSVAGVPTPASPSGGLPERRAAAMIPAVQAAAAVAGGFVAGAAVVGLVNRRRKRSASGPARRRVGRERPRRGGKAGELVQVVGSRSLLLDVHLLGRPDDR